MHPVLQEGPCVWQGVELGPSYVREGCLCSMLGKQDRLFFAIPPKARETLKHPSLDLTLSTGLLPRGKRQAKSGHCNNDSHNIEIFLI